MRKQFALLFCTILSIAAASQSPQKFSYQSVIRNTGNQLVVNQQVGIKISILQGSANGSAVYSESHSLLTNANGLASLEIGGGTVLSGNFANINWPSGPYFVKTETDLNGANNYTITSTQQLLSVPYALYSNDVSSSVSVAGDTLFIGSQSYIIPGISSANNGGGQTGITAHTCGATNVHNPAKTYGTMTDQQGNVYRTIVIGNQEWMAENLKTSVYRNGDPIANVTDNNQWASLTTGAWCYYNNDSQYDCPYGKLYNWYACTDSRGLCPIGWHVPTFTDWNNLDYFVELSSEQLKSTGTLESGTGLWHAPNTNANNNLGFSAIPGGIRNFSNGSFSAIGNSSNLSSTTIAGPVWSYILDYSNSYTFLYDNTVESDGLNVRCIKD
jgi:uncharacterized protein (TIGR02145 family)